MTTVLTCGCLCVFLKKEKQVHLVVLPVPPHPTQTPPTSLNLGRRGRTSKHTRSCRSGDKPTDSLSSSEAKSTGNLAVSSSLTQPFIYFTVPVSPVDGAHRIPPACRPTLSSSTFDGLCLHLGLHKMDSILNFCLFRSCLLSSGRVHPSPWIANQLPDLGYRSRPHRSLWGRGGS